MRLLTTNRFEWDLKW